MVRSFISISELLPFCKITKKEGITASMALCLLLLGLWLPQRITLSTSPSLDHRIFFLLQLSESDQIKTGDFIVFSHPDTQHIHRGLNVENDLLIKKVGCAPGEMLTTQTGTIYCENSFLGTNLISDGEGRPLPQFTYNGLVPANKYFMIGGHERSFDSRYFGFINAYDFRFKAWPLL
jgi:conjugal transfer pilin signal peptidase TrbI